MATATDPNGNETTYDYGTATSNPAGNLLSITAPATSAGTAQVAFTYNAQGQVLTATAPVSATAVTVTQNTYDDSTGYLMKTIKDYGSGKLNAETDFSYDTYGHVASVEDPNRHTVTITTNAVDQVTEVDGPSCDSSSAEVVQFFYDGAGNTIASQKKLGTSEWQKVVSVYNSYEQLWKTEAYTDASTYLTTAYAYDLNGNQTSVTDPLGHGSTMAYDETKSALQKDRCAYQHGQDRFRRQR